MKFLSSLPENSFPLSQEKLKLLCQYYYRNFTGTGKEDLDSGDQKTFEEILEKIKHAKHDQTILELTCIMPPGILYKLVADLEVEIYTIESERKGNIGENPSLSFYCNFGAFFVVI